MRELVIESPAKINLALEVIGERDDGYHDIETVFQEISLKDTIYIRESDDFTLTCTSKLLPLGEGNLVYKAWDLIKEFKKEGPCGIRVHLEKNIPIEAGLAGGSSNAASILKGLNKFWDLGLRDEDLVGLAKKIGADVPYFIGGKTAFARGIGDDLTQLRDFSGKNILLVNTGYGVSTQYIYENLDLDSRKAKSLEPLVKAIEKSDDEGIYKNLTNRLEEVTIKIKPDIQEIKDEMLSMGAKASLMCGSGPTVFGIFEDRDLLEKAFIFFKDKFDYVYISETI